MNLTEPMASVVPGVTGAVLAVLARIQEPLTGRSVASRVKSSASQRGVSNVLAQLVEEGLVDRVDKGRGALFTLNRDHIASGAIIQLAALRQRLIGLLTEGITSWKNPPMSATLFGSFARGEGTSGSDIDLLLVHPRDAGGMWGSQLTELTIKVRRWTGNPLNIIDIGEGELAVFAAEPFMQDAASEGLTLAGLPLRTLIRRAAVT